MLKWAGRDKRVGSRGWQPGAAGALAAFSFPFPFFFSFPSCRTAQAGGTSDAMHCTPCQGRGSRIPLGFVSPQTETPQLSGQPVPVSDCPRSKIGGFLCSEGA